MSFQRIDHRFLKQAEWKNSVDVDAASLNIPCDAQNVTHIVGRMGLTRDKLILNIEF